MRAKSVVRCWSVCFAERVRFAGGNHSRIMMLLSSKRVHRSGRACSNHSLNVARMRACAPQDAVDCAEFGTLECLREEKFPRFYHLSEVHYNPIGRGDWHMWYGLSFMLYSINRTVYLRMYLRRTFLMILGLSPHLSYTVRFGASSHTASVQGRNGAVVGMAHMSVAISGKCCRYINRLH